MSKTDTIDIPVNAPGPAIQEPGPQTHDSQVNPYLFAKRQWDERYGDLLTRARNWRLIAFGCAIIAIIQAAGMIALSKRAHVIPYVVEIDKIGRYAGGGPAEQASSVDPRILRATVTDWLERVRTITNDTQVQRGNIDHIYAMLQQNSAAFEFLNEYYRANNPFQRGQSLTVSVEIHSVVPTSPKTYDVTWTETARNLHGEIQSTQDYRASITIMVNPPSDDQTIAINPLGIYVYQIGWSKIL